MKKFIIGFFLSFFLLYLIDGTLYLVMEGYFQVKVGISIIAGAMMGGIMNIQNSYFLK